jgi:hypothetical protein
MKSGKIEVYRFFVDKYFGIYMLVCSFFIVLLYRICIGYYLTNKWLQTNPVGFSSYLKR